eukprot:tig00000704_g3320.t1
MDNADSKSVWTASSVTLQTPAEISCFASSGNCVAVGAGRRTIVTSIPEDLDRSCVLPDHDPFSLLHFLRQGKKSVIEKCAKNQFLREKNPSDSLLLYLALGKKNAVLGLYKAVKDTKLASFLQNDFEEERWRTAALRNAYVLMGQHKFEMAAAFFLLGGQPDDATNVCLKQMRDLNLAVVISRLVGGDASDLHKKVLQQDVIPMTQELNDPILRCMAHWSLGEFSQAADCLHIKVC